MEAEVTQVCGPKGKHRTNRKAVRHGTERGRIVLGGHEVHITRPRCRTADGLEIQIETYTMFQAAGHAHLGDGGTDALWVIHSAL